MVVLRKWRARKDLANEVDSGITACSKFTNDFELASNSFVVVDGWSLGRLVEPGDVKKGFALEGNSLANNVALGKDCFIMKGDDGV
jgi:hypothetical protein